MQIPAPPAHIILTAGSVAIATMELTATMSMGSAIVSQGIRGRSAKSSVLMVGGATIVNTTVNASTEEAATLLTGDVLAHQAGKVPFAAIELVVAAISTVPSAPSYASAIPTTHTCATLGLGSASVGLDLQVYTVIVRVLCTPLAKTVLRYARASTQRTASQQMVHALVPPAGLGSFAKSLAGRGGMERTAGTSAGARTGPSAIQHQASVRALLAGEASTVTRHVLSAGGGRSASKSADAGTELHATMSQENASARLASKAWTVRFLVRGRDLVLGVLTSVPAPPRTRMGAIQSLGSAGAIRAGKESTVLHVAQSQVGAKNAARRAIANMGRVIRTTASVCVRGVSLARGATSPVRRVSMVWAVSRPVLLVTPVMGLATTKRGGAPAPQDSLAFSVWSPVQQELLADVAWASAVAGMVATAITCLASAVVLVDGLGKIVAAPAPRVNLDQTVSTTVIVTTVPSATLLMANVNASQVMPVPVVKTSAPRVILVRIATRLAGVRPRTTCATPPLDAFANQGFKERTAAPLCQPLRISLFQASPSI